MNRDELKNKLIEYAGDGNLEGLRTLKKYVFDDDELKEALFDAVYTDNVGSIVEIRKLWGGNPDNVKFLILNVAVKDNMAAFHELMDNWGLTVNDLRENSNEALIAAAANGSILFLNELRTMYRLDRLDAISQNNKALKESVKNRHCAVVASFRKDWGLTRDDLEEAIDDEVYDIDFSRCMIKELLAWGYDVKSLLEPPLEDPLTIMELRSQTDTINVDFDAEVIDISDEIASRIKPSGKCFNSILYDYENIRDYLDEDKDNFVIFNIAEGEAICSSREMVAEFSSNVSNIFKECIGGVFDNGDRTMAKIQDSIYDYIKLPLKEDGSNSFLPKENIVQALSSRERLFCLVPLKDKDGNDVSLSHTASHSAIYEQDSVSANHCQRGSNVLISKLSKCRFSARAPSWTLLPPPPAK